MKPFFSVVIPTRNRYDTLRHTMRTVLDQGFSPFELIISDNSDEEFLPQKELIAEQLKDERVRYFRTPSLLSMTDSWEFAIAKAEGDYLILFGDDDGLVPGALENIAGIIRETHREVVSWSRIEYSWPEREPVDIVANLVVAPYNAKTGVIESDRYIREIINHEADYRLLPMFYNSAISRKLIDKLKARVGRVFNASSPDVFTGYAFAHMLGSYLTIGQPLSINGVSARSNGAVHHNHNKLKDEHWNLLRKSAIQWPAGLPEFYTAYLGIVEPFVQLTKFFPELGKYISRKNIFKIIIDYLESSGQQDLEKKIATIIDSAGDDPALQKWVSGYLQKVKPVYQPVVDTGYSNRIGFNGDRLILDASKFGLTNVYDVSQFMGNIFGQIKNKNYNDPAYFPLLKRARKAAAIILKEGSL
jgi:glycosyltransferase involved in cell wall biosynthesis